MHAHHFASRQVRALFGLVLLGVSACSAPKETVRPEPPPAAEKPAKERISSCLAAMGEKSTESIVMACRHMWRDTACQDAWASSLDVLRGDRARVILTGCLPAYCTPNLPICSWDASSADLTATEPDWLEGWAALNRAVLPGDLDYQVEAPEAGEFAKQLMIIVTLQR